MSDKELMPGKLTAGLSISELQQKLYQACRLSDAGNRALAFYLHDFATRRLFQMTGHSGVTHFAEACLGLHRRTTRELLRVGRALVELPKLDEALEGGHLPWSKVRTLSRVVVPETQEAWISHAAGRTCRELLWDARRRQKGELPPENDQVGLPRLRFRVTAELEGLDHAKWERARRQLCDDEGRALTDQEVLKILLESFLQGGTRVPSTKRSPYRVVVHKCPSCATSSVNTFRGQSEVTPSELEMVECDAEIHDLDDAGMEAKTPKKLRAAVLARDDFRCLSCRSSYGIMVHHKEFRAAGGKASPDNLMTLCARCHAMVHEGFLEARGSIPHNLSFYSVHLEENLIPPAESQDKKLSWYGAHSNPLSSSTENQEASKTSLEADGSPENESTPKKNDRQT